MARFSVAFWLVILCAAAILRVRHLVRARPLALNVTDVLVGVSVLGLLAFSFYRGSDSAMREYLLPVAWCFPFLVGHVYAESGRKARIFIGSVAAVFAIWNIAAVGQVIRIWNDPQFVSVTLRMPDVRPAVRFLEEKKVTRAYGSFWIAYPVTYLTDEKVICSQPFNERFPGWPLPYKEEVDASPRVAFVLKSYGTRRVVYLTPESFEKDLAALGLAADRTEVGGLAVFMAFRRDPSDRLEKMPSSLWNVTCSRNSGDAERLRDGDRETAWRSGRSQEQGMWIQVEWPGKRKVGKLVCCYGASPFYRARSVKIRRRVGDDWQPVAMDMEPHLSGAVERNGHPVYGGDMADTIRFAPVLTDGLRIEIQEPADNRDWQIRDLALYAEPDAGPSVLK